MGERLTITYDKIGDFLFLDLCHPYAEQESNMIDDAVVARASPAFDLERDIYYEHRRDELERQDLLRVAALVADAFDERATLTQDELNAVIARALSLDSISEIVQCRDRLSAVGYVWKPPGAGDRWQAGIPSLMHYVRRR